MFTGNLWQNQNPGAHTDVPVIHSQISAYDRNKYSLFLNREFIDKIQKPGDSGCDVKSSEFFKETAILWFISVTSIKTLFLNRRAAARNRALASIIPGRERPEETTICYKI